MKILLIVTNQYRGPIPVIPLGACLVAESCERTGHQVQILDFMFERDPLHALNSAINKTKPDIIGISLRNIDNNDMQHPVTFYKDLTLLIETIRRNTNATVILGGAAVGVMPEALLRFTGADWAILGDGEIVLPEDKEIIDSISGYGIVFDTNWSNTQYRLFANCKPIGEPDDYMFGVNDVVLEGETLALESGIEIKSTSLGSQASIVFIPPTPLVFIEPGSAFSVQISFQRTDDIGATKVLDITSKGVIDIN